MQYLDQSMVISSASDSNEGHKIIDGGMHTSASWLMFSMFVPPHPIEAHVPLGNKLFEMHMVPRIELPAKGWGIIRCPMWVKCSDPMKPCTDSRSLSHVGCEAKLPQPV